MKTIISLILVLLFVPLITYSQSERQSWTLTGTNLNDIIAVILIVGIFAGLWRLFNISSHDKGNK